MNTRKKVAFSGVGIDLMSGAALAWAPHQWLWIPFGIGALLALGGFLWPRKNNSEDSSTDNRGGAFAGRDNTGNQQVVHGDIHYHGGSVSLVGGTYTAGAGGPGGDGVAAAPQKKTIGEAPTLLSLYESDFSLGKHFEDTKMTGPDFQSDFKTSLFTDFQGGAKFLAFYVPDSPVAYRTIEALSGLYKQILSRMGKDVEISLRTPGENATTKASELAFTGFVYVYSGEDLNVHQQSTLVSLFEAQGAKLRIRGRDYLSPKLVEWYRASAE